MKIPAGMRRWHHYSDFITYRPEQPFTVDGISYDPDGDAITSVTIRAMFSIESAGGGSPSSMHLSAPPLTDKQLDSWVRFGYLDIDGVFDLDVRD